MTAPSRAGLSPLLDQLDEARAKGTVGPWAFDGYCRVVSVPHCREYVEAEGLIPDNAPDEMYEQLPEMNAAYVPVAAGDTATKQGAADAALIVAAVNAAGTLTSIARAAVKTVDDLRRVHRPSARDRSLCAGCLSYLPCASLVHADRLGSALAAHLAPATSPAQEEAL